MQYLTLALLTLAGCSYGPEKIRTGEKPPEKRTQPQIAEDMIKAMSELEKTFRGGKDAATAQDASQKVTAAFDRLAGSTADAILAQRSATAEQNQQFESQHKERIEQSNNAMMVAFSEMKKIPGIPPEFSQAVTEGGKKVEQAKIAAHNQALPEPPEILPLNPPKDASSWVVWLLCILILAICSGLLFRDGLWSNAIRLVNVVFAGLLAMNFYEPLASFMTGYSEDLHTFVSLFDFLALWACFVVFMAIFRAATDAVSKVRVRFLGIVDRAGGIVLSLVIGWVMAGFTLVSLHTAPLGQYPLLGSFQPQNKMFLGVLAPDREWLGFTKYQSWGSYCRSVDSAHFNQCIFPSDFIEANLERRMHIENYMIGNSDHAIRVDPRLMTGKPKPPVKKPDGA